MVPRKGEGLLRSRYGGSQQQVLAREIHAKVGGRTGGNIPCCWVVKLRIAPLRMSTLIVVTIKPRLSSGSDALWFQRITQMRTSKV